MADVEAILEKLRSSLKRRGAEGIRGLGRHFKIIDRSGDGHIDAEEFAQLCKINRLGLDANEQAVLLHGFDADGNGKVSYEEFLRAVRGRLNSVRKKMVRTIFDALDKIGGDLGYLTIASIQPVYSVSSHPMVKAGKMTKEEALQEFLNGFEGSQVRIKINKWPVRSASPISLTLAPFPLLRARAGQPRRQGHLGRVGQVLRGGLRVDRQRRLFRYDAGRYVGAPQEALTGGR